MSIYKHHNSVDFLSTMEWGYDENDINDPTQFYSTFRSPSPVQNPAITSSIMSGVHSQLGRPSNPHATYIGTFNNHFYVSPAQSQVFLTPETLSPQYPQFPCLVRQFEDEDMPSFSNSSPSSQYEQSPGYSVVKLQDEPFPMLHHPMPSYLPPTFFLLDTSPQPTQGSLFSSSASSSRSSRLPTPVKPELPDEEVHMDRVPEVITPESSVSLNYVDRSPLTSMEENGENYHENEDLQYETMDESRNEDSPYRNMDENPQTPENYDNVDVDCEKTAPYAVLIHRALMSTPTRRMVLSQIYDYFREKIPRFKKVKGRGWMNSIRHNLSMNGAFLKEDRPADDPGKGYIWVLSEEAEREGVKSTTRYRKSPPNNRKRGGEDNFGRSSGFKRRRKSTRKWTASKQRESRQTSPAIKCEGAGEFPMASPDSVEQPPLLPVTKLTRTSVCKPEQNVRSEYASCYSSFQQLSFPEIDDELDGCWQPYTEGPGDSFGEEYTLVTQK
ncbi:hypothetical protein RUND412_005152 [Rhizina undulata]